ncbi:peptidylprolyl isomerase [Granulosicoccus antarcticus]|uniref:Chaperone SurA n=1 Tax=Granulosicoccus antarcticus IMCC3135 TaxID=1192854 RepID=A0A2Z2NTW3_9GAMM|nr:peptidylprolyl isomerase [Granulosicoccus antarcticus]ASJ72200.1 Chaperone SurA [Granulosicoccus antarcticus IMCC3135]
MIDRSMVLKKPSSCTVALLLACLCTAPLTTLQAQSQPGTPATASDDIVLDGIRAVVNEGVVLDSDVISAIEFFKQQARSNRQTVPPDDVLANRVLEDLINQEIRRQHARETGISTDAASVNRAIEQIARNNNMDTLQFRQTLQNQGFNYDLFRQNIEQELLMQRLIEREVQSRIRVSQQEIDDYVDSIKNDAEEQQRYRIQHILLAVPESATAEQMTDAESRAEEVLTRLRAGDDFAEVATALSDGARALQGGDLGWRTLQELPEFLSTALKDMSPGDLSEPLRSANGLHVIRLSDRQSGDQTQQEQTLARHIFIAGDDSDVENRLREVRTQLLEGGSFDELAAKFSEDPNSAKKGGELPWFSEGQLPPAMEDMANSLALNELSEPFRTQFGWHLLEVVERRTQEIDENALREQANNALRQGKVEQEIERWSRQLRDESFVEIRN